jgi:hypothetical protein
MQLTKKTLKEWMNVYVIGNYCGGYCFVDIGGMNC